MSIQNAAVVTAPTSIAPTGGTALSLTGTGISGGTDTSAYVASDTDLRTRRRIDFNISKPRVQNGTPNGYTQAKCQAKFFKPKTLANGKITVNSVSILMSYDVETSQTEIQELMDVGAQLLFDADFTNLWKAQNLS